MYLSTPSSGYGDNLLIKLLLYIMYTNNLLIYEKKALLISH